MELVRPAAPPHFSAFREVGRRVLHTSASFATGLRELVLSSEELLKPLQFRFRLVGIFLRVLGVLIVQRRLRPR